ncbi:GNAT family N-acetyltransferase [Mailhella massiliensis]|uniref:GNAT family N-acetyltransferase n=1 Tax=Mailhella massiliensis TaxID=1903261 RepID=A0A921DS65_9BACT|nr:GNAT family N-acetyltransferase [Mailhella massiliensis]HJD98224.1 GNAT family N-acetyltransferase [Mailhella massiliensis]
MNIEEVKLRSKALVEELVPVWESSVRATHGFLSPADIDMLRPLVRDALNKVPHLFIVREKEHAAGFLGMDGQSIDMLFVDASFRGKGLGGALMRFALKRGARFVDVNEQNPEALSFYLHMGFSVMGRDEKDGLNLPFPILHLCLNV